MLVHASLQPRIFLWAPGAFLQSSADFAPSFTAVLVATMGHFVCHCHPVTDIAGLPHCEMAPSCQPSSQALIPIPPAIVPVRTCDIVALGWVWILTYIVVRTRPGVWHLRPGSTCRPWRPTAGYLGKDSGTVKSQAGTRLTTTTTTTDDDDKDPPATVEQRPAMAAAGRLVREA